MEKLITKNSSKEEITGLQLKDLLLPLNVSGPFGSCHDNVTVLTSTVIYIQSYCCRSRNCRLPYREVTLNLTPLVAKLMAKYYVSFDFRPVAMEFSTGHLVLCNHIYLSGCSQFKQVETRSNQLDLVPVHMV